MFQRMKIFRVALLLPLCFALAVTSAFATIATTALPFQTPIKRPIPAIAQHPTCPVAIQAIRNVNVDKDYYWRDVEIDVTNISSEPVTKIRATLNWIVPEYTRGVPYVAKFQVLPGQTVTLKCIAPPYKDIQQDCAQAAKAYFMVEQVDFQGFLWDYGRGKYLRPSGVKSATGDEQFIVDEELTKKMLIETNAPANWEKSDALEKYYNLMRREVSSLSSGPCKYTPLNSYTKNCPPCAGETLLVHPFALCRDTAECAAAVQIESFLSLCGSCSTWDLRPLSCGTPNPN